MKSRTFFIAVLILMLSFTSVLASSDVVITATDTTVTATDVPENANLIVGLYKDGEMLSGKFYDGADVITANYSEDMADTLASSTAIQAFVWDKNTIEPFANKLSANLTELPVSSPTPKVIVDGNEVVFDSAKPFISE